MRGNLLLFLLLISITILGQDKSNDKKYFENLLIEEYEKYEAQLDSVALESHFAEDGIQRCYIIYLDGIKCVNPDHYKSGKVYYIKPKPSIEGFIEFIKKKVKNKNSI